MQGREQGRLQVGQSSPGCMHGLYGLIAELTRGNGLNHGLGFGWVGIRLQHTKIGGGFLLTEQSVFGDLLGNIVPEFLIRLDRHLGDMDAYSRAGQRYSDRITFDFICFPEPDQQFRNLLGLLDETLTNDSGCKVDASPMGQCQARFSGSQVYDA